MHVINIIQWNIFMIYVQPYICIVAVGMESSMWWNDPSKLAYSSNNQRPQYKKTRTKTEQTKSIKQTIVLENLVYDWANWGGFELIFIVFPCSTCQITKIFELIILFPCLTCLITKIPFAYFVFKWVWSSEIFASHNGWV